MPFDKLQAALSDDLASLERDGRAKGAETVFVGVLPPGDGKGPRYLLDGEGERAYLRMNSNGYLGLASHPALIAAEEDAVRRFGTGPGAVRFISGAWQAHVDLEHKLAAFHGRDAAMIFSSAYAAVVGILSPLITPQTAVVSDALNHNCIINAIRLAQPQEKYVYDHLDMAGLKTCLDKASQDCRRAIVISDGIFSMRGDHAPLDEIMALARSHDAAFAENVVVLVDDSHGVGAFGDSGRGSEEFTGSGPADLLVGTLGKAFGVNGGYVCASETIIRYLRETSPTYIYSNPITPGEAAAACAALDLVDSPEGSERLAHLRAMTQRFEGGLIGLGFETISGSHPVVPLMVRDTARTAALVAHLRAGGVLATGLNYPVVPKGDEEIRFQISADHTPLDIDEALDVLAGFEA